MPWTPLGALPPDPRYRLVLRTRHGAPQPLTPSAAYDPPGKNPVGAPGCEHSILPLIQR